MTKKSKETQVDTRKNKEKLSMVESDSPPQRIDVDKNTEQSELSNRIIPADKEGLNRRRFLTYGAGLTASLYVPTLLSCGENPVGASEQPKDGGIEFGSQQEVKTEVNHSEPSTDAGISEQREEVPEQKEEVPEPDTIADEAFSTEGSIEESFAEPEPSDNKESTFSPNTHKENQSIFPYGVQAGAMRSSSVILWTYISDKQQKTLKVWRAGSTPSTVVMAEDSVISPNTDGYFKSRIKGLQGDTWYSYAFFDSKGSRSSVGKFQTAFGAGVLKPLIIGATTCTNSKNAPFEPLQEMAKQSIDTFVHLGDMSYNDGARTIEQFRKKWQGILTTGGYKELLQNTGYYITWDDHEISNNLNPETIDKKHLSAAKQSYFETLPTEQGPNNRLWNSYVWGDTAEIFLLDSRSERKPSTRKSKSPIYLGETQMRWLKERLSKSTAHFKILMNSVPMTNMPIIWPSTPDRWEGYKTQREELLTHISSNNIKNVWFLSGDFHVGFVSKLEKSGQWSHMYEIAVGPGGSNVNPFGLATGGIKDKWIFPKNQFLFGTGSRKNTTVLTFDPKDNSVRVKFVDVLKNKVLFDKKLSQA